MGNFETLRSRICTVVCVCAKSGRQEKKRTNFYLTAAEMKIKFQNCCNYRPCETAIVLSFNGNI